MEQAKKRCETETGNEPVVEAGWGRGDGDGTGARRKKEKKKDRAN